MRDNSELAVLKVWWIKVPRPSNKMGNSEEISKKNTKAKRDLVHTTEKKTLEKRTELVSP